MDTLSSSASTTFHVPNPFNPSLNHHHHHHLKPTSLSHHHHHLPATKTNPTSSFSRTNSFPRKDNVTPLYRLKPSPPLKPPRSSIHRKAVSGYAAALLDIAQCNGTVLEVAKDVIRLLRLLKNEQIRDLMMDELVEEKVKGEALKELVVKGKFQGHLVGLVKMVIDKGKSVDLVKESLEEFQRIFYQLTPPSPAAAPVV